MSEREYPIEHKLTILRQCFFDPELYEQRDEVWLRLAEMDSDGNVPKQLVSSEPTGRRFKVTRKVTPEAIDDAPDLFGPKPHEVLQVLDPSFAIVTMLEQVEGDAEDLSCIGLAKSLQELGVEPQ